MDFHLEKWHLSFAVWSYPLGRSVRNLWTWCPRTAPRSAEVAPPRAWNPASREASPTLACWPTVSAPLRSARRSPPSRATWWRPLKCWTRARARATTTRRWSSANEMAKHAQGGHRLCNRLYAPPLHRGHKAGEVSVLQHILERWLIASQKGQNNPWEMQRFGQHYSASLSSFCPFWFAIGDSCWRTDLLFSTTDMTSPENVGGGNGSYYLFIYLPCFTYSPIPTTRAHTLLGSIRSHIRQPLCAPLPDFTVSSLQQVVMGNWVSDRQLTQIFFF